MGQHTVRKAIKGVLVFSIVLGLSAILETFLICRPFTAHWDPEVLGSCGHQIVSFAILESFGLAADVAILVIPIRGIYRLQLPRRKIVLAIISLDAGVL